MDDEIVNSRLSRITTVWTMLAKAHGSTDTEAAAARLAFIQRYQRAAYRYLLGAVRDPDAADELFQELALRFVRGDFRRADRRRGRFRNYLKTTLSHLVVDYRRRQLRQPTTLDPAAVVGDDQKGRCDEIDEAFLETWRDELLERAWQRLEHGERNGGPPYYTVLKYRAERPQATSADIARHLANRSDPDRALREPAVRKTLQRARAQFADYLLDEVARSLQQPTHADIEQELIDLDLLRFCRTALQRRK